MIQKKTFRTGSLLSLLAVLAMLLGACGASLQEDSRDSSNYNPDDFKNEQEPPPIAAIQPDEPEDEGPRDPDGLLYRTPENLHPYLREVRLADDQEGILLIFEGGEALKVKGEDIDKLQLVAVNNVELKVRIHGKDYTLSRAK